LKKDIKNVIIKIIIEVNEYNSRNKFYQRKIFYQK